jgi:HB1, ASXL, restriction endonuclease HTH domain
MSTKKKSRTIPSSSKPATTGRQTRAAKAQAVPAAAPTPAELHSEGTTEMPFSSAPEPAPAEAEAPASVAAPADHAPSAKKRSALEAAFQVLRETGQPMSCPELIAAMAAKGYWSSPKGRTPAATLYSALLREVRTKGNPARFCKTDRGKFALRQTV